MQPKVDMGRPGTRKLIIPEKGRYADGTGPDSDKAATIAAHS